MGFRNGANFYSGFNGANWPGDVQGTIAIPIGKWVHLAYTVTGLTGKGYVLAFQNYFFVFIYRYIFFCFCWRNGQLSGQGAVAAIRSVTRSNCLIGRSPWGESLSISAFFDDFKIFNKSLTQSEILLVLNSYY